MAFPVVLSSVPLNPSGVLVFDQFADANNTQIDAHTPDIDTVGGGWSIINASNAANYRITSNTFEINENRLGSSGFGLIDAGRAGVIITGTVVIRGTNPTVFFRCDGNAANPQNEVFECNFGLAADALRLSNVEGGTSSLLDSVVQVYSVGDSIDFTITLSGTSITCRDDTNGISVTATSSVRQTETEHGFGGESALASTVDNFRIVAN